MNTSYGRLTGRRAWYVTGISVWGDLAAQTLQAIATETYGSGKRVVFYQFAIAGEAQEIAFASLTDHRGNMLPNDIERPVVMVIPKNAVHVVVVGQPTDVAFRLARSQPGDEDGLIDLWIVEAGA